jgi:membrane-bound ClpP family serine protease
MTSARFFVTLVIAAVVFVVVEVTTSLTAGLAALGAVLVVFAGAAAIQRLRKPPNY